MSQDYQIQRILGQGTYGYVVKAKCKLSGRDVAIKLIRNIFETASMSRFTLRELQLMDELSKMEGNIYTVKMLDVILPVNKPEDLQSFQFMFIVMEYIELDVLTMFSRISPENFTEKHVLHIMYNTLCCLNFLETANVLHRDLKPNNILITDECTVMICDFGLARSKPIEPEECLS